mgnify:CR=1 FL=1
MKISYKWLKEFVKTDLSVEKISAVLTQTGLEVEGVEKIERIKGGLEGVYIGEILSCEKHPDADRLKITQVDIGSEKLQIVCGAPNVKTGQKVPVAIVGSTLYPSADSGFKIKKSKIRGVESFGMICAEDELGLGKSHDGIMVLDSKTSTGLKAAEFFKLESDYQIEIGLTPNRADAMSHLGVARDLKAFLNFHENANLQLSHSTDQEINCIESKLNIDISVENNDSCPSYLGTTICDVEVKESPDWLKNKLITIGLNPINNIVDITNYVMHELGTPLHAFDADCLNGKIVVKNAIEGDVFQTLDGNSHKLKQNHLMITNGSENLCIAGVFGGQKSGITANTKNVFLECAYFHPTSIRKTAKDLGLNTDASFRFERGIDPSNLITSLKRAALLIEELSGGTISMPVKKIGDELKSHKEVIFNPEKARKLIGNNLEDDSIKKILLELDIEINSINNQNWCLSVPIYRIDVNRQADVVEEVLRIYGFDKIEMPEKLNSSISSFPKPDIEEVKFNLSSLLISRGYYEVMNNSLTKTKYIGFTEQEDKFIKVLNPLSNDLAIMRRSMDFGLLENIQYNSNRQKNNLKLFEFGKVYHKNDGYVENNRLSIAVSGKVSGNHWNSIDKTSDYFTIKGMVEALFNKLGLLKFIEYKVCEMSKYDYSYEIFIHKTSVGTIGKISEQLLKYFDLKQSVFIAELNWDDIISKLNLNSIRHKELPKTFAVKRDLSLLLDQDIQFSKIQSIARKCEKKYLKKILLFDVYEGKKIEKGKKSYSVSFILQNDKETMKENQIESIMQKIQTSLIKELGASLR